MALRWLLRTTRQTSIDRQPWTRWQAAEASVKFHQARRRHPGVEPAIGALQSGNGLARCRDMGMRRATAGLGPREGS